MRNYTLRPAAAVKPIPDAKHAEDAACPDAGWKPLSKEQKAKLSMLARSAAEKQGIQGGYKAVDEWRHTIAIRVCGVRISEAVQDHYADLKSAFEDLGGKPEKAFKTQMRAGDNKRRIAMHKLTQALNAGGLHSSYAASICKTQFKCPLEEASAKQLWCLFFTITKRRKS